MKALPAHPLLHPHTGRLVFPIGFRKDGRPIWPAMGGDENNPAPQPAAGQPPAPAPPAPPAPPPTPGPPPGYVPPANQPPAPQPQQGAGQGDPDNFPANTPVAEMTRDQQLAYWKHHARRHEQRVKEQSDYDELKQTAERYQQLVAASQTDHERAVEEARRQGRVEAITESGTKLVDQWLRVAIGDRLPQESVDALLAPLDRTKFLKNGDVDTAMVYAYAGSVAPAAPQQQPQPQGQPPVGQGTGQQPVPPAPNPSNLAPPRGLDLGQGQPSTTPRNPLEAGRERARARFSKTATAQ